jgi:hypothetical protein
MNKKGGHIFFLANWNYIKRRCGAAGGRRPALLLHLRKHTKHTQHKTRSTEQSEGGVTAYIILYSKYF